MSQPGHRSCALHPNIPKGSHPRTPPPPAGSATARNWGSEPGLSRQPSTSVSPCRLTVVRGWGWSRQRRGPSWLFILLQRQQRPRGICPNPPFKQLPGRPAPPPHDARRPAGRGPSAPPPSRPSPLAAPHPKSLLVDGGTFLWSVPPRADGEAWGWRLPCPCRASRGKPERLSGLNATLLSLRPRTPRPAPEPAPWLPSFCARLHAFSVPPSSRRSHAAGHLALGAHAPHHPSHAR